MKAQHPKAHATFFHRRQLGGLHHAIGHTQLQRELWHTGGGSMLAVKVCKSFKASVPTRNSSSLTRVYMRVGAGELYIKKIMLLYQTLQTMQR